MSGVGDGEGNPSSHTAPPRRGGAALEEWLKTEHLPLAEQLDRLAADIDLYRDLQSQGFSGRDYEYFETVLACYGQAVIAGWLCRRTIEAKCREKRLRHVPRLEAVDLSADDVDEIVLETVAEALFYFRDRVLAPSKWDANRGASLRTFFIGQCLIRFVAVMNRWLNEQNRDILGDDEDVRERDEVSAIDVEGDVITSLATNQALRCVSRADARIAISLQSQGFSLREIGNRLGRTEKAVEGMIAYAKRQIRQQAGRTETA